MKHYFCLEIMNFSNYALGATFKNGKYQPLKMSNKLLIYIKNNNGPSIEALETSVLTSDQSET